MPRRRKRLKINPRKPKLKIKAYTRYALISNLTSNVVEKEYNNLFSF